MRRIAILIALGIVACGGKNLDIGDYPGGASQPVTFVDGGGDAQPGAVDTTSACGTQTGLVVLASSQSFPASIALDSTHVYWTSADPNGGASGSVEKVSICGGAVATIASGTPVPESWGDLVVDATNVYWDTETLQSTGLASVMMAPIGGGVPVALASTAQLSGIGVSGGAVYWGERTIDTEAGATTSLDIRSIVPGSGSPSTVVSGVDPYGLVVTATDAYWAAGDGTSAIWSVPLSGGTPQIVADGMGAVIQAIAVDAANVYWTASENVLKAPLGGGGATTVLASGQSNPRQLRSDGTNVYWINEGDGEAGDGSILKVPVAGGAITTLASSQNSPQDLAIDATSLYWVNSGSVGNGFADGAVMKLTPR